MEEVITTFIPSSSQYHSEYQPSNRVRKRRHGFLARKRSSKKGLSLAEKRLRLEELFHESKEFFQLKEVLNSSSLFTYGSTDRGYQEKKIMIQSIKDILQSLVDDGIVKMDKIGTSNYFWSFPSEAKQSRQNRITAMEKQLETLQVEAQTLQNQIHQEMNQRKDSPLRTSLLKNVADKEKTHMEIVKELERYHDSDPTVIEAKERRAVCRYTAPPSSCWTSIIMNDETLSSHFEKFERFRTLKKQGIHLNKSLDESISFQNPRLLDKLMDFVGIHDHYGSNLPIQLQSWKQLPSELKAQSFGKYTAEKQSLQSQSSTQRTHVQFIPEKESKNTK
ncbi:hypothetical protein PCK1_002777 [Pneumocystis canis]|nr:hypothetical protein PCK1_002777 [Pneumocystis canis]